LETLAPVRAAGNDDLRRAKEAKPDREMPITVLPNALAYDPRPCNVFRNRMALGFAVLSLFASLSTTRLSAAENHPQQIKVNGKNYRWPQAPVVVVLIDDVH
jgi:hypothetical protein